MKLRDIILEKIKTITHQGNLEELKSKNKKFLNDERNLLMDAADIPESILVAQN